MDGYSASLTSGSVIFRPRTPRTGNRGVVLLPQAGTTRAMWLTNASGSQGASSLAALIAACGIPCIASDAGGTNAWGTDAVVNAGGTIDTDWAALQTACGVASDKVLLLGISRGSLDAARYMAAQPSKCAGAVRILPMASMHDFYENNRGGYQSSIAAGWSVTAPAALAARAYFEDSANLATLATSGPLRDFYSTADALMTPSLEGPFIAALVSAGMDAAATVIDTTLGHVDGSTAKVDVPTVVKFLVANGA